MTSEIQQQYQRNPEYWRKDKPKLVGDLEQRPKAVEMLGNIYGKKVIDAGCGTGFVTRMIARKGARVTGIDISEKMLDIAREFEEKIPLGISYEYGDIAKTNTTYNENSYDAISCTGVVHFLYPQEYKSFLQEARKLLKKDSPLVISLTHPTLFYPTSPARTQENCWVKVSPNEDKPFDKSQRFDMHLYDTQGNCFDSSIWHHPISFLLNELNQNGFNIDEVFESIFRKEHRLNSCWGDSYGYPSHLVIKATSGGRR